LADPQCSLLGIRRTLAAQEAGADAPGGVAPVGLDSAEAALTADGLTARVRRRSLTADVVNGHIVHASAAGTIPTPVALTVALPLASAERVARVGVVAPPLRATMDCARTLAGEGAVAPFRIWPPADGSSFDVIVCGPGPLSGTGSPLTVLSREALRGVRARLAPGGAFGLWLPVATVEPDALRRALAAVRAEFPAFQLFLWEHEAVIVAAGNPTFDYARLRAFQPALVGAGLWDPMDLVAGFSADAAELAPSLDGVAPYRAARPHRMPVFARRPAARLWAPSVALLAQHRLAGPQRLMAHLTFESENQKAVALHAFDGIYADETKRLLRRLGRLALGGPPEELVDFVIGPLARRELFADEAQGRDLQTAAIFMALGLPEAAAGALRKAVEAGRDEPALHLTLAEVLAALNRPEEALAHYGEVLRIDPASEAALQRMTALLVSLRRYREAAESLERILAQRPGHVQAMLLLGQIYASALGRRDRAAELAQQVLAIEPGNADAQDLLTLCSGAPGDQAPR